MKSIAALRLDERNPTETATLADGIVFHMTGNSFYPSPTPSMAELTAASEALKTSIINASGGDREMIAIRNEKLEELSDVLIAVASYIQVTSKGIESVILSAGVPVRKPYARGVLPTIPENFKISKLEFVGTVLLEWKSVKNSRMYLVQKNADPNLAEDAWTFQSFPTKASCEVNGITLAKPIAFRVAALNANGQSEWSNVLLSPSW